ncbi:MITOGEN-ACTIVATED PROTEIN KINASE KINASE KINASE 5 [Salix viminalis]|uniref:MITOGEN-ACTIVATED PROTEIN KINASE KINASE KINASE 5 n=1 Tax=Salix viminalis TaxID=40686 RepID=A0A9Q0NYW6_SALVM|nr:MITOGEN-ACTIVATED PROTEIN KINASE KINASE KINASE 5 [Salix viminalis]
MTTDETFSSVRRAHGSRFSRNNPRMVASHRIIVWIPVPFRGSTSASVAVPLPLPLPVPSGDGDSRLPSPKERIRDGFRGKRQRQRQSIFAARNTKKMIEQIDTRSSWTVRPDLSTAQSSRDNFEVNIPIMSAPASPFASPIHSPPRTSSTAGMLHYYRMIAKSHKVWSAPEMATLDTHGLPPPAFMDISAFSNDSSPSSKSAKYKSRGRARSPTGPLSPLTTRSSIESSAGRRESNANFEVHPLPLPPGAAVPSPSVSVSIALHKPEFPPMKSQWQKGKLIGRGETGALCAMKEVEMFPDDPKSAESIKRIRTGEIKVLIQLKASNIVQYYGSEVVDDKFYIYLTYLHSMKTIHRDIKGANLLVDASGIVKLADFGMAKLLTGQAADLSLKGSPYWMAPELMQAVMRKDASSDLALAVDIWSLGCTIIEMFTGKPPWSEYEGAAAMFKVMRDSPAIPEILSPEGKDFLRCCFRRNPAERPTAAMLLEHRWLKSCQQVDVSSTMQSINGINLTDISQIRRASEFKFDHLPGLPSSKSIEGKATSDSYMHYSFYPARLSDDLAMKLPS